MIFFRYFIERWVIAKNWRNRNIFVWYSKHDKLARKKIAQQILEGRRKEETLIFKSSVASVAGDWKERKFERKDWREKKIFQHSVTFHSIFEKKSIFFTRPSKNNFRIKRTTDFESSPGLSSHRFSSQNCNSFDTWCKSLYSCFHFRFWQLSNDTPHFSKKFIRIARQKACSNEEEKTWSRRFCNLINIRWTTFMTRCRYVPSLLSLTSTHFYLALLGRGSSATHTGWEEKFDESLAITDEFYTVDWRGETCKEPAAKLNFKVKTFFVCIVFYSPRRWNLSKEP